MVGVVGTPWRYSGLYGGCTGGHTAVRGMLRWQSWEMHGGAGDCVRGIRGYKWQHWDNYGGSTGGCASIRGSSMVGVSEEAWRYWGVLLTKKEYWGIPWPHNQTRGTVPAGMYIA